MIFTDGEDVLYERLMQGKPNFDKREYGQAEQGNGRKTAPGKRERADGAKKRADSAWDEGGTE